MSNCLFKRGYSSLPFWAQYADVADLNGDGILDLVTGLTTGGTRGTQVQLGRGDGTFSNAVTIGTTSGAGVFARDLNEDGVIDIYSGGYLYLGKGDGTFGPASNTSILALGSEIFDFNGDGHLDLIRASTTGAAATLYVSLGNGDGSFQSSYLAISQTGPSSGGTLISGALQADINKDGIQDLVFAGAGAGFVYLGSGSGSYSFSTSFTLDNSFSSGDINSDGNLDIVSGTSGRYYLGNGAGQFTLGGTIGSSVYAVGDLNGDSIDDAVGGAISLNGSTKKSALWRMQIRSAEDAQNLLRILDGSLDYLLLQQSKVAIDLSSLEIRNDSDEKLSNVLKEQLDQVSSPDISLTLAELVSDQIRQQAQIAVLMQANLQMQSVLKLLQF